MLYLLKTTSGVGPHLARHFTLTKLAIIGEIKKLKTFTIRKGELWLAVEKNFAVALFLKRKSLAVTRFFALDLKDVYDPYRHALQKAFS